MSRGHGIVSRVGFQEFTIGMLIPPKKKTKKNTQLGGVIIRQPTLLDISDILTWYYSSHGFQSNVTNITGVTWSPSAQVILAQSAQGRACEVTFEGWDFIEVIDGSLEVKLQTIWTDGKAEVGRVREEKSRREKIREEKE